MKLKELIESLENIEKNNPIEIEDWEIVIPIAEKGTIGPEACVSITNVNIGFDWNSGRIFLVPKVPLVKIKRRD